MKEKLNKLKDNFQNYRDKPFRPHQIEALEQIMECESRVIVLKAPPGSGKSLIGMTMLQEKGNGLYLVHSKMLQTQLNKDFPEPESVVLFGRSNYPCGSDRAEPGTTAADCIDEKCKLACEYKLQKKKAVESPIACLNYCIWEKAEILTQTGIKMISEIIPGDMILSMNNTTKELEYKPVNKVDSFHYQGAAIRFFGNKGTEYIVTPNHKMIYLQGMCNYKSKKSGMKIYNEYIKQEAKNIQMNEFVHFRLPDNMPDNEEKIRRIDISPFMAQFSVKPTIRKVHPRITRKFHKPLLFRIDLFLELLGWYISEGNINKHAVIISQLNKNRKYKSEITTLLRRMVLHYKRYATYFFIPHQGLVNAFKFYGGEHAEKKFIHHDLFTLPKEKLQYLFDSLMKGDGHRVSTLREAYTYSTKSIQLKEDLTWLATFLGYRVRHRLTTQKKSTYYTLNINRCTNHKHKRGYNSEKIEYDGIMHNLSVEDNHNYFMGNAGTFILTGNSYFLTETNYVGKFSERDLVVIDEADILDKIFSDFIGLSISERNMRNLNLRTPEYKSEGANALIDWQDWAKEGYKLTCKYIELMKKEEARWGIMSEPDEYERSQMKKLQQYRNLKYRFGVMIEHLNKDWVCQVTESKWGETWAWKPNWMIPELAEHALWGHGGQFLLMSGTMHPKPILSLLLGIPENDIEYFEVKTAFPPENRPIYLKPVANMVYKEMKEETPKIVEAVSKILTDHPNVKGIIHTVSYALTQAIMEIDSPRLITHDTTNKQEVIQKFRDSIRPLILVSPSSERGLDLPDEACRLIIMIKAPFLSLGDKFVSKRVYSSKTGQKWYISDLLMTVEQAASRGMRHQEDFCTVICLDKQIIRAITDNPGIVSEYFRESLIFCGEEQEQ